MVARPLGDDADARYQRLLNQRFPTFAEALATLIADYSEDRPGVRAAVLEAQASTLRAIDTQP